MARKKTGVPTLVKTSTALCRALDKYAWVITKLYPDNTALAVALATAQVACQELRNELEKVREYGD
jgi:hypothetical protein